MSISQDTIDVSIIVLTYYHEKFIAQALDSILSQQTKLKYEILIGDDASEDRTPEIIAEYARRYPKIIRPFFRKENLGATRNSWELRQKAKGKYVASLEGDDFWIDPQRLQKQWEFLESNADYIGCCGKCLVVNENGQPDYESSCHFAWNKKVFTMDDMIESWQAPAQGGTLMYRNVFRGMEPEEYAINYQLHRNVGDKTTYLFLLSFGPIYCSNEIFSAYRFVDKAEGNNWFSIHHANPYRDYDMFMYPCKLESWARKRIKIPPNKHFGKRNPYRFARFVRSFVREPEWKKTKYLLNMLVHSHQPLKYSWYVLKALIEME